MKPQLNDYKNMINKKAWYFTKRVKGYHHKDTFEDFQAQGYLIFCEALESFDESRASFSTYLYKLLTVNLNEYIKKYVCKEHYLTIDYLDDIPADTNEQLSLYFETAVNELLLSEKGTEIIDFLLSFENEKIGKKKLKKYFVSTNTLKLFQFDIVFEQLKKWWQDNKKYLNSEKNCQNLKEILANLG